MTSPAIVFDIGGVLLDWNPRHLYRKLLPSDQHVEAFFEEVDFASWNLAQDAGRTWQEGVSLLSAQYPHHRHLIKAANVRWIEMISSPIAGTVALLEELHARGAPLFAITNFSSEKWIVAHEEFPFLGLFRDVVVSGDERVMKPDPAIFEILLSRQELRASDCIFIDDSAPNVAAANKVGMNGLHFRTPERLHTELLAHGALSGNPAQ